jgi:hypothetical protein
MSVPDETWQPILQREAEIYDQFLALKRAGNKDVDVEALLKQIPVESHTRMRRAFRMAGFLCDITANPPVDHGPGEPMIVDGAK